VLSSGCYQRFGETHHPHDDLKIFSIVSRVYSYRLKRNVTADNQSEPFVQKVDRAFNELSKRYF
jgi:hypothetical protein